ncbi:MAG: hypothetical protein KDM91_03860, partial [Verrucomicrobiae bacterium]|nr:hypothetical protein [Verrucomicrobiae bacterium]
MSPIRLLDVFCLSRVVSRGDNAFSWEADAEVGVASGALHLSSAIPDVGNVAIHVSNAAPHGECRATDAAVVTTDVADV